MEHLDEHTIRQHLLQIASEDSQQSFRIVYNHYYDKLFQQAMFYFNDPEISQEIVSDVFIALWQSRKILDKIDNPDAYLFISLKHARSKYVKRNFAEKIELFTDNLPNSPGLNTYTDTELLDTELQEKYQVAFNKLPPRCAEVFRLVREEKKKYAEAAEILGISAKTVDNQMNKAVKVLYAELKEHLFSAFF